MDDRHADVTAGCQDPGRLAQRAARSSTSWKDMNATTSAVGSVRNRQQCGVGLDVSAVGIRVAGGGQQGRRGVDAGDVVPAIAQVTGQPAFAAADVEGRPAGGGSSGRNRSRWKRQ